MRIQTAVLVWLFASGTALAQVAEGPRFRVNAYTTGGAGASVVAADAAGHFVVVWRSGWVDDDGPGLAARRYEASGAPIGAEFRVATPRSGLSVASDADGDLIVVSDGSGPGDSTGVFGQRIDSTGAKAGGEFRINDYTTDDQRSPDVAAAPDGSFIVAWTSYLQDGSLSGAFGQRYDAVAAPLGPEFQINALTTGHQGNPRVAAGMDGEFVVVWSSDGEDGSAARIVGQRYDVAGAPAGAPFQINQYTTGRQIGPRLAMAPDGTFVVVWNAKRSGGQYGIRGRRLDATGLPLGADFVVESYATGGNYAPDVAVDGDGSFVVVWESARPYEGYDIASRWFDASGNAEGGEVSLTAGMPGFQRAPAIAPQGNGRFVVTWNMADAEPGVFAQLVAEDLIFRDGFESGGVSAWSSASTGGGDLTVSPDAGMNSTSAGLRALVDDTAGLFVQDDTPHDESRYRARFYFDPNGFDPGEALDHRRTRIFLAFEEAPSRRVAAVVLRRLEGEYALRLRCRLDDDSQDDGAFVPITGGPHFVELDWRRSSFPATSNGSCRLAVDGVEVSARTGLDNSVSSVDFVRLGALSVKTGATGTMYWDEFESRRRNPLGP